MSWRLSVAWTIEFTTKAAKAFRKLDKPIQQRIVKYLREVAISDPRTRGKALTADFAGLWRWRVGNWRIMPNWKTKQSSSSSSTLTTDPRSTTAKTRSKLKVPAKPNQLVGVHRFDNVGHPIGGPQRRRGHHPAQILPLHEPEHLDGLSRRRPRCIDKPLRDETGASKRTVRHTARLQQPRPLAQT